MESFYMAAPDILKALKGFKRLAKQDVLASGHTSEPEFWLRQAEARRAVYEQLMQWVQEEGVAAAYEQALRAYAELPLQRAASNGEAPEMIGRRQALEMFFQVLGAQPPRQDADASLTLPGVQSAAP